HPNPRPPHAFPTRRSSDLGHLVETAQQAANSGQRIARKGTLFMFDEPTTGLHFDDIAKLMKAFAKLLDAGHSIVLIEHNLDVIKSEEHTSELQSRENLVCR